MKCKLSSPLILKDGTNFPKGASFNVKVNKDKPTVAILTAASGREIKIRSIGLSRYFKEFDKPNFNSEEMMDSIVPSLTGESVEPDGWDEHGFPSMLLAAGMI